MLLSFPETPTFGRCYPRPCSAKLQLRPNDKLHAVRRPVTAMASRSDQPKLPVDKCYKVFVERQDTQIEQIIRWSQDRSLDMRPSYQRDFVWKEPKSSKLIETILLKLPLQEVWLHQQPNESYEVIDGQQRLTTIIAFERGKFDDGSPFILQRLEILEELNGKSYADLVKADSMFANIFKKFSLPLRIVKNETDATGVFEVYQRINTGAENLNAQQIRRAAYRGSYIDLLHKLAKKHMSCLPNSKTSFAKEQDREYILRFFAMHNSLTKLRPPLYRFLNAEMQEHQHMQQQKADEYAKLFRQTFHLAIAIFGRNVFQTWDGKKFTGSAVDITLWDMVMLTLVDYSSADLQPYADRLQQELLKLKLQLRADRPRVSQDQIKARRKNFTNVIDTVRGQTSHHNQQARTFSPDLKAKLFAASNTCSYCRNVILRLEDADVDHIVPFSKGGMTEEDNAQLLHTDCNKKKSDDLLDI